jgi:hypothetical protein
MAEGDEQVGEDGTGADYRNRTRAALAQIHEHLNEWDEATITPDVALQMATISALLAISASVDQLRQALEDQDWWRRA